jgi:hypothetical protein
MYVSLLVFLVCFGAGVGASARWLPDLAVGRVGGLAFFATCGLLATALSLVGVHVYELVEELNRSFPEKDAKNELIAAAMANTLRDAGTVFGLGAIVYLLAPGVEDDDELAAAEVAAPS